MLSFIYQIMREFEVEHGIKANVLYLNNEQFDRLRQDFSEPDDIDAIISRLDMELVIDKSTLHPHLSHHSTSYRQVASF